MLIKEICKITGLKSSTVRYYDKEGLLGEVKREGNNYRKFCGNDVNVLNFIKKARELGFTLDEIKQILRLKDSGTMPCDYVTDRIKEKIHLIEHQMEHLEQEKKKLQEHLAVGDSVCGCHGTVCHYIEGLDEVEGKYEKENLGTRSGICDCGDDACGM